MSNKEQKSPILLSALIDNESRRDFIVKSGVVGASIAFGSVSLAAAGKNKSKKSTAVNMKKRKLGPIEVSELGAGAMSISANYGHPADKKQGIAALRTAHDNGVTFFDTAEVYGPYTSELLVGEALKPFRNQIVLATKFGFDLDNKAPGIHLNSQPKHIKKVVEESLKRLQTDHIDLLYQHRVDPNVPIEDVANTMKELVKEGKILHYGLSEPSAKTIRRAHAVHPIAAVQTEYSIMERDVETNGVLATCEELGIGFVPWGPVGMGYLTGKMNGQTKLDPKTDFRSAFDRFSPENLKANMPFVDLLQTWSKKKNVSPTAVALAWLLAQKPFIVSIPGTRSLQHLTENLGAVNVEFSQAELQEFNAALNLLKVHGGRMNADQMKVVDTSV